MINTRIKICGLTTPEDAALCESLGADYLGLIFAESPRRVTPKQARHIRDRVPDATIVGVFKDQPLEEVIAIVDACDLNLIQLHGSESPKYCSTLLAETGLPTIKAFSAIQTSADIRLRTYDRTSYFLLDLDKNMSVKSNIGIAHERLWDYAAAKRRMGYRIFLAGAITPDNVRHAIKAVHPYCIDVASGVESAPGVKDHDAVKRLMKAVRR